MALTAKKVHRNKERPLDFMGVHAFAAIVIACLTLLLVLTIGRWHGVFIGGVVFLAVWIYSNSRPPFFLTYCLVYFWRWRVVLSPAVPASPRVEALLDHARRLHEDD